MLPPTFILTAVKRYSSSLLYPASSKLHNPDNIAGRLLHPLMRFATEALCAFLRIFPALHRKITNHFPQGRLGMMTARTRYFDDAVRNAVQDGAKQVVILAAGLDTRAHRLKPYLNGVRVFELDLPRSQQTKINALRRAGLLATWGATFVEADFSGSKWIHALKKAGCDMGKERTCVIWEGCTYYLTADEVDETLRQLHQENVSLSFDFVDRSVVEKQSAHSDYVARKLTRTVRNLKEPWHFGIPDNRLESWAKEHDWKVVDSCCGADGMRSRLIPGAEGANAPFPFWGLATMRPSC